MSPKLRKEKRSWQLIGLFSFHFLWKWWKMCIWKRKRKTETKISWSFILLNEIVDLGISVCFLFLFSFTHLLFPSTLDFFSFFISFLLFFLLRERRKGLWKEIWRQEKNVRLKESFHLLISSPFHLVPSLICGGTVMKEIKKWKSKIPDSFLLCFIRGFCLLLFFS